MLFMCTDKKNPNKTHNIEVKKKRTRWTKQGLGHPKHGKNRTNFLSHSYYGKIQTQWTRIVGSR